MSCFPLIDKPLIFCCTIRIQWNGFALCTFDSSSSPHNIASTCNLTLEISQSGKKHSKTVDTISLILAARTCLLAYSFLIGGEKCLPLLVSTKILSFTVCSSSLQLQSLTLDFHFRFVIFLRTLLKQQNLTIQSFL